MRERDLAIGIIGCGAYGREHATILARMDGVSIRAVCDVDPKKARLLGEYCGASYFTRDPGELIRDDVIDAVYICTHHESHADLAVTAAESSKNLFIEKPLALTVKECTRIVETVDHMRVKCMVGFKLRFYPSVPRLRRFIPAPRVTIAHGIDDRWPDDFWANDPIKGGGNVLSEGCHVMDLVYYLNRSEPVRIYAEGGNYHHNGVDIVDTIVSTITFESGAVASVAIADAGMPPFVSKFSFQLMDGVKSAHLHNRLKSLVLYDGVDVKGRHDQDELGVVEENRAFIHALRHDETPSCTHYDGLRATAMIQAAFESLKTKRPVELRDVSVV